MGFTSPRREPRASCCASDRVGQRTAVLHMSCTSARLMFTARALLRTLTRNPGKIHKAHREATSTLLRHYAPLEDQPREMLRATIHCSGGTQYMLLHWHPTHDSIFVNLPIFPGAGQALWIEAPPTGSYMYRSPAAKHVRSESRSEGWPFTTGYST